MSAPAGGPERGNLRNLVYAHAWRNGPIGRIIRQRLRCWRRKQRAAVANRPEKSRCSIRTLFMPDRKKLSTKSLNKSREFAEILARESLRTANEKVLQQPIESREKMCRGRKESRAENHLVATRSATLFPRGAPHAPTQSVGTRIRRIAAQRRPLLLRGRTADAGAELAARDGDTFGSVSSGVINTNVATSLRTSLTRRNTAPA
jgi:hypothetical protein